MSAPRFQRHRTAMDPELAPARHQDRAPLDELPLFAAEHAQAVRAVEGAETRARIEAAHEDQHPHLMRDLREHALDVYRRERRPVSTNDIRHLLPEGVDRRVLGVVFKRGWQRVGTTETRADGATVARVGVARSIIGTYVPKDDAA